MIIINTKPSKDTILNPTKWAGDIYKLILEQPESFMDGMNSTACELIRSNKKISAIKLVRMLTGVGLKEAKDHCDELDEEIKSGKRFF